MSAPENAPSQLGLARARDQLSELVNRVASRDEVVHLARRGRTVATLVSPARLAEAETNAVDFGKLADVTSAVVTTLDVGEAMGRLVRIVADWLADACAVELVDGERLRVVAAAERDGGPTRSVATADLYFADDGVGAEKVLRDRGAIDVISVPLVARDRSLGTLSIGSYAQAFGERERHLAAEVARRASMAAENARLYTEQHGIVERLQGALLGSLPTVTGLELAGRYRTAETGAQMGGDWYDAFLRPGGELTLVIGDVAGHNLDAAVVMSQLRTMVRAAAWLTGPDPAAVVAAVEEVNEGLSLNALATLIVATLRPGPQGWELAWVNAGHHPPLVVTPDGQMRLLDTTPDLLVGVTVAARRTHRQLLEAGSTLLLYTDGLIERRAKTSERLHAKLRLTVSHFLSAPLDELCSQVITEAASGPLEDDVALLALRVTASTPASTS